MRAEVLTDLLAKLDECVAADEAKSEFRRIILAVDASHSDDTSTSEERTQFARRLLAIGEPRTTIRDRLMHRYRISRAQAYRHISDALKTVS